ncbi:CLIP domain-containing serine protease 2 [Gryllus bimaculatus]|nr:CLIP domain-containing serine protease 2 [Gryllus bimaculatus]
MSSEMPCGCAPRAVQRREHSSRGSGVRVGPVAAAAQDQPERRAAGGVSRAAPHGDSGGPLQVQEQPRSAVFTVVGVTSFGPDPCGGKKPGVYVRVANYVPWIESVVWE